MEVINTHVSLSNLKIHSTSIKLYFSHFKISSFWNCLKFMSDKKYTNWVRFFLIFFINPVFLLNFTNQAFLIKYMIFRFITMKYHLLSIGKLRWSVLYLIFLAWDRTFLIYSPPWISFFLFRGFKGVRLILAVDLIIL